MKRLISTMITAPNKNANNNIKDKVGIVVNDNDDNNNNNVGDNDDNVRTAYDEFRREAWLLACNNNSRYIFFSVFFG